jgi:hypothetical protein
MGDPNLFPSSFKFQVRHQFPIKGAGLGAGSLEDEPEGGASGVAFSRWSWLNQEASGRKYTAILYSTGDSLNLSLISTSLSLQR